jgi:hypothetical protein
MGIFTEYLDQNLDWNSLALKRKEQLSRISKLRGGRAILTFAAAMKKTDAPIAIDYDDRVHFARNVESERHFTCKAPKKGKLITLA